MSGSKNSKDGGNPHSLPLIRCIRQEIKTPRISDLEGDLKSKIDDFGLDKIVNPNDTIAITASSRGINRQSLILKILVEYLLELKASPFIIPAMGSHGGATVEGQLQILKDYGITEEKMGCPIKASMDVVEIGKSEFGSPIYIDKFAASADKIIIVNKIKTHSKFLGEVESGLSKMCLIGLGKHEGAKLYHRLIDKYSWSRVIKSTLNVILKKLPIICGIGIIQNINNEPAQLHVVHPDEFLTKEPELLLNYKELTEHLPFKEIDLLIVDEMGKNIFGTGMDTNITGRKEGSTMHVQWLFVRDLTEESHGNAQGVGLADFTTKKLVDKIDYNKMYTNALTAFRTDSPKIPVFLRNDEEVLKTIFKMGDIYDISNFKLVWIKNTLELQKIIVSEVFFDKIDSRDDLELVGKPEKMMFDKEGFLINSKSYW